MISNGFEVIPVALCGDTIPNESMKNLVVKNRTMIGHLDGPGSMPPPPPPPRGLTLYYVESW